MSSSKENAAAIDNELLTIVRIASAAGLNDAAELIQKRVIGIADKAIAEVGNSSVKLIVAGHSGFICDECIRAAVGVVLGGQSSSEASQPDTLREAWNQDAFHAKCSRTYCDAGDTHSEECRRSRFVRPILAALAEAERNLADVTVTGELPHEFMLDGFRQIVTGVEGHYDGRYIVTQHVGKFNPPTKPLPLPGETLQVRNEQMAVLTSKLADAEKRAKDAEQQRDTSNANYKNLYYTKVVRPVEIEVAALTRKLVTAREALNLLRRVNKDNICPHTPQHGIGRSDELACYSLIAAKTLAAIAAIDAPAGEDATESESIPPRVIDAKFMAAVQEGTDRRAVVIVSFTTEEARKKAAECTGCTVVLQSGRIVAGLVESSAVPGAHQEVTVPLCHYANLAERGDALEKAAGELIESWDRSGAEAFAGSMAGPFANLRSALARAKENR